MSDWSTSRVLSEGVDGGDKLDSGSFDGLGGEEDGSGAKRALDFDSMAEESDIKGEDPSNETREGDLRMEEPEKKRRSSTEIEGKNGNKKKRKSVESPTTKRTTEKERRDHLKQLRVESQRILRETRDVSFKPVPVVQKPISSILEKIRKRKLEVSKKYVAMKRVSLMNEDDDDAFAREVVVDCNPDEEGICKMAFELIFAFDEVISLGHKENVTVAQVKQHCEMESHEEKLHKLVLHSKINETKDHMKRKASEIEKSKSIPNL
ncbi:Coatomer subunit delta-3 [Morella rubra]|uniref:Coatomer subunit delta-3 n=1 Tax=Morella rubra TaxID=262757 RepID=A0A6A1W893_9ROSI|nr:Coatomer subunit delta-3 [Morella rubra]